MGLIKISEDDKKKDDGGKKKKKTSVPAAVGATALGSWAGRAGGILGSIPFGAAAIKQFDKQHMTDAEAEQLREIMGAKDIAVDYDPTHPAGPHYDPNTNKINAPKNSYVLAHELGHATGPLGGKVPSWLRNLHGMGYTLGTRANMSGLTGLAASARALHKERTGEDSDALRYADYLGRAGTAAQLTEEAQASLRGINAIRKLKGGGAALRALGTMAPAYATYASIAGGNHLLAPYLTKKLYHGLSGEEEE